jgi:hypothetical protein
VTRNKLPPAPCRIRSWKIRICYVTHSGGVGGVRFDPFKRLLHYRLFVCFGYGALPSSTSHSTIKPNQCQLQWSTEVLFTAA